MASFWPTDEAKKAFPEVAEGMRRSHKYVFSRSMAQDPPWHNSRHLKGGLAEEIRAMKAEPGDNMVILGSGSLVAQLAPLGLIDEYQMVVVPVALGAGKTMFEGMKENLKLKLAMSRTFLNGRVLLSYRP